MTQKFRNRTLVGVGGWALWCQQLKGILDYEGLQRAGHAPCCSHGPGAKAMFVSVWFLTGLLITLISLKYWLQAVTLCPFPQAPHHLPPLTSKCFLVSFIQGLKQIWLTQLMLLGQVTQVGTISGLFKVWPSVDQILETVSIVVSLEKAGASKYQKTGVTWQRLASRDMATDSSMVLYVVLLASIASYHHSSAYTVVSPLLEQSLHIRDSWWPCIPKIQPRPALWKFIAE